jgi:hypothetical protein
VFSKKKQWEKRKMARKYRASLKKKISKAKIREEGMLDKNR